MMRLPSATSVSTWQALRAVRGAAVFKSSFLRPTLLLAGYLE